MVFFSEGSLLISANATHASRIKDSSFSSSLFETVSGKNCIKKSSSLGMSTSSYTKLSGIEPYKMWEIASDSPEYHHPMARMSWKNTSASRNDIYSYHFLDNLTDDKWPFSYEIWAFSDKLAFSEKR